MNELICLRLAGCKRKELPLKSSDSEIKVHRGESLSLTGVKNLYHRPNKLQLLHVAATRAAW